ncbi:hypothetical protein GORHZ_203_00010, partial [Gordonia rhizosphera NBRC 16068]
MPDKLYIAIDGTGVPMTAAAVAGRAGKGPDGRAHTREVKLAAVFTQTAVDDDGRPIRDPDSTSYVASFATVGDFAPLAAAEATRRGAEQIRQLVVLGDGAAWIWNLATARWPHATPHRRPLPRPRTPPRPRRSAHRHPRPRPRSVAPGPPGRPRHRRHRTPGHHDRNPAARTRSTPRRQHRKSVGLLHHQRPPHALRLLPRPR